MVKCKDCANLRLVIEVMQYTPFTIEVGDEDPSMKDVDGGEVCGHYYECGEGHDISEHCHDCGDAKRLLRF